MTSWVLGPLGAGLVDVPPAPAKEPQDAILSDPIVPEGCRFCSRCDGKVGRGTNGEPGLVVGECARCGHRFSFFPKLSPGDVLNCQYEVIGCLSHGGLGWVYLARDRAVSGRCVVLKGVLDPSDEAATAAALAERRFLAEVEHPNIVKIHNFVRHHDDRDGTDTGYIVMEYLGGQSLKDMVRQRRRELGRTACLPLPEALALVIEALRPLDYLHTTGLLFCDFKPDNVIQTEYQVKLVDLGAVRRLHDRSAEVYATPGYDAPELATIGPSPASDIYAVGRTLAVLTIPFDFKDTYRRSLPSAEEAPLFAQYPAYHRALARATDPDPRRRFPTANTMAEQLTGVLREVLAAHDGKPRPAISTEFTPERRSFGVHRTVSAHPPNPDVVSAALPLPRVDSGDPAASFLVTVDTDEPEELIELLLAAPHATVEVCLRLVRAQLKLGDVEDAETNVNEIMASHQDQPVGWRVLWYHGLTMLAMARIGAARRSFAAVLDALPGELAPKLALASCAEHAGDFVVAERCYQAIWRTDRSFASAAFGLARTLLRRGDRQAASSVLESVPEASTHFVSAQLAAIRISLDGHDTDDFTAADLEEVGRRLAELELDHASRDKATCELLETALRWVRRRGHGLASPRVLDCPLIETELRFALERRYRAMARKTEGVADRVALLERAIEIRPRTWL